MEVSGNNDLIGACGPKIISSFVKLNGNNSTFAIGGGPACASSEVFIGPVKFALVF